MTNYEVRFNEIVPNAIREIAEQLKIANQLKAIELKAEHPGWKDDVDAIDGLE